MGSSAGILPGTEDTEDEVFAYAMQLANGSALSMTLLTAVDLQIFDVIAKAGPGSQLSASEIASQMPTRNPDAPVMLDRVLRLLASHRVLTCSLGGSQRVYGLASVAKYLVPSEDGDSLAKLVPMFQDNVFLKSWTQLKDAILEGGVPFDKVHGTQIFKYLGSDPRFNQVFNIAMINHSLLFMKKILQSYHGFENVKQLVDVGGGLGGCLSLITSKYPSIKGINFDLPHVIDLAPHYPGVEHVAGDMFVKIPQGDTIFMKWILHDWSDDLCLKVLKNCCHAIPDDGIVIVAEVVLPVVPETTAASRNITQMDVLMMTLTHGGKERTKEEFLALATAAGFRGIRFVCNVCDFWVMEFYK